MKYFSGLLFVILVISFSQAVFAKEPSDTRQNIPYGAYITRTASGKTNLHVKNVSDDTEFIVGLPPHLFRKIGKNRVTGIAGIRKNDRKTYFSPQKIRLLSDGKIMLAFGNFLVGVDTTEKKFLCSKLLTSPPYEFKKNFFTLDGSKNLPYAVVGTSVDGKRRFQLLIDLSEKPVRYYHLYKYPQQQATMRWEENSLTLDLHQNGAYRIEPGKKLEKM